MHHVRSTIRQTPAEPHEFSVSVDDSFVVSMANSKKLRVNALPDTSLDALIDASADVMANAPAEVHTVPTVAWPGTLYDAPLYSTPDTALGYPLRFPLDAPFNARPASIPKNPDDVAGTCCLRVMFKRKPYTYGKCVRLPGAETT